MSTINVGLKTINQQFLRFYDYKPAIILTLSICLSLYSEGMGSRLILKTEDETYSIKPVSCCLIKIWYYHSKWAKRQMK